ncbi:MAG: hypothetical protein PHF86_06165 [Candidatus Nanoarchaeia archaeon]|nr:hypothetical protein [Candidatus Nanoarchaeia archaeon]
MKEEEKLAALANNFRILSDWKIVYDSDSQYKGHCCKNVKTKKATVYAWYSDEKEPEDYLVHEVLHIAIAQVIYSFKHEHYEKAREKEELLIQDICKLMFSCKQMTLQDICSEPLKPSVMYMTQETFDEFKEFGKGTELFDADPKCEHEIVDVPGGGVKCTKCTGWFCF